MARKPDARNDCVASLLNVGRSLHAMGSDRLSYVILPEYSAKLYLKTAYVQKTVKYGVALEELGIPENPTGRVSVPIEIATDDKPRGALVAFFPEVLGEPITDKTFQKNIFNLLSLIGQDLRLVSERARRSRG